MNGREVIRVLCVRLWECVVRCIPWRVEKWRRWSIAIPSRRGDACVFAFVLQVQWKSRWRSVRSLAPFGWTSFLQCTRFLAWKTLLEVRVTSDYVRASSASTSCFAQRFSVWWHVKEVTAICDQISRFQRIHSLNIVIGRWNRSEKRNREIREKNGEMLVPPDMVAAQSKLIYQLNKFSAERVQARMLKISSAIREIVKIVQDILKEVEIQEPRFISSLTEYNGR